MNNLIPQKKSQNRRSTASSISKSKINMKRLNSFIIMAMVVILTFGASGCKSSKKAAEEKARQEAAAREAKIAEAREVLMSILNDEGGMTLAEKERALARVKAMNLDDQEINELIAQVEALLEEERNAANNADAGIVANEQSVQNYFNAIANANSINSANSSINEALNLFASEDAPVLIIINKSGDIVDYDEPTTIRKYLEYLKDQKKNINKIDNLELDANGKIKELILIK